MVKTNSYASLDQAVVLPYVNVARHARLTKVVIDRGVQIPEGLVVGEDPEEDARWFRVSEGRRHAHHAGHARPARRGALMRVLSVASECVPFVKTGGLADVVGALPLAMGGQGVEMRVLLPGYPQVMAALGKTREVMEDETLFGGPGRVLSGRAQGIDLLVLEADHLFGRGGHALSRPRWRGLGRQPRTLRRPVLDRGADRRGRASNGKGEVWRPDICMAMTGRRASRPIT
jgi:hypothetical protein